MNNIRMITEAWLDSTDYRLYCQSEAGLLAVEFCNDILFWSFVEGFSYCGANLTQTSVPVQCSTEPQLVVRICSVQDLESWRLDIERRKLIIVVQDSEEDKVATVLKIIFAVKALAELKLIAPSTEAGG